MPIRIEALEERGLLLWQHRGAVSDAELIETYQSVFDRRQDLLEYNLLIDLRLSDSRSRSAEMVRSIARSQEPSLSRSSITKKIAIIAEHDLTFGLSRMFQAHSDVNGGRVDIFRSIEEGIEWLDLESKATGEYAINWLLAES